MTKYFVDTNVFLRTLVKEDTDSFNDCLKFLRGIKENQWSAVTTPIVLAEVAWTLGSYYRFPKSAIIRGIQSIVNIRGLTIGGNHQVAEAVDLYRDHSVKFVDAMIASIPQIRMHEWIVISYDHDFDAIDCLRKEPGDIQRNVNFAKFIRADRDSHF